MTCTAILLSGGIGSRIGASTPKQYLPLMGKPLASHSFELFQSSPLISQIIVVCDKCYQSFFPGALFAEPGMRRQDSLFNGLQKIDEAAEFILIHDAARPFIQHEDIENVVQAGITHGAATLATPVIYTIKEGDPNNMVVKTLDRSTLYNIQTPQVIRKEILFNGFKEAEKQKLTVTDDVSLAELIGHPAKLVIGSYENIKITTPEDFAFAEMLIHELKI